MAHAHIHILGSRAGYTTLDATPGVTTAERAELEVLSFGDATNAEAMARLETHASMIGRRLRSGRFAISRMLPGGTDDAGRPTIEVVSLLVDLASYTAILGALARLASDARLWRVARGAVSRGFEVPEEPVQITASDPRVLRAFDAWIAARKQGATAVLGAGDEPGLFAMVALLDTDDLAACRWGVGVLSLSAPVDVCTLAPTTAAIGPRPVLRASTAHAQPWLNAEMAAAEEHAARNPLLPPSASLAQAVRIEPAFDRPARATPAWDAEPVDHEPQLRRKSLLPIAAVSTACSLALLAVMAVAYARGRASTVRNPDSLVEESASGSGVTGAAAIRASNSSGYDHFPAINDEPVATTGAASGPAQADAAPSSSGASDTSAPSTSTPVGTESTGPQPGTQVALGPAFGTPSTPPATMNSYYLDDDGDGKGDASSRPIQLPADTPPDGYSKDNLDQCDKNPFRYEPGKCGCEYQRKSEDCEDDEDGDGVTNAIDEVDDRSVRRDEVVRSFKGAKDAANSAKSMLDELAQELGRESDHRLKMQAIEGRIDLIRAEIDSALLHLYSARFRADFGDSLSIAPAVGGPPEARRIIPLMEFADFDDFFSSIETIDDVATQTVEYWNRARAPQGRLSKGLWQEQLSESWKEEARKGGIQFVQTVAKGVVPYLDLPMEKLKKLRQTIDDQFRQARDRQPAASRGSVP